MYIDQEREESYARDAIKVLPDILKDRTAEEVDGIENMLNLHKNMRILDLCCAWGRHCIMLARKGYQYVTGIDISQIFLSKAREDAKNMGVKVQFFKRDMRNLQFREEFNIVINMYTSFGLFEEENENLRVLKEVFLSLRSGGNFLIDMVNREHRIQKTGKIDYWPIKERNNNAVRVGLIRYEFDSKKGMAVQKFAVFDKNGCREHIGKFRLYTKGELTGLLKAAGFKICNVYGNFHKGEYSINSPRLIVVAQRP